jgi:hypothetical protein
MTAISLHTTAQRNITFSVSPPEIQISEQCGSKANKLNVNICLKITDIITAIQ